MKECKQCKQEKDLDKFHKGFNICKVCRLGHEPYKKPTIEKECKCCKIIKPLEQFRKTISKNKEYATFRCKECDNRDRQIRRIQDPNKESFRKRKQRLKRKYNISIKDYNNIYNHQNGKCLICKKNFEKLNIDHCHKTNKIRGLLCSDCNVGLGFFKDNSTYLLSAVDYLIYSQTDKSEFNHF